jgi:hypothetical protein
MSGAKDLPCSAAMRHIPQFSILLVVVGAAYEVPAEPIGSLAGKARRRSRLPHSSGGRVGSTNVRSDLPAASGDSVETERLTSFALLTEPRLRPAPSLMAITKRRFHRQPAFVASRITLCTDAATRQRLSGRARYQRWPSHHFGCCDGHHKAVDCA